jgi:hypothetical protein
MLCTTDIQWWVVSSDRIEDLLVNKLWLKSSVKNIYLVQHNH